MSEYFNEKARDWDADEMVKQLSCAIGSSILEQLPLEPQMRVMDFGAGTGLISSHVAPHVQKIIAVDTSQAMLNELVSKPEFQNKVEAVCQNILDTPLQVTFDLIMSAMAMHHVADTNKLIQTFAEHIKPGGKIALADLDHEDGSFHPAEAQGVFHTGFHREELKKLLEKHGFTDIKFITTHTVSKETGAYPVFLLTAKKSATDNTATF